jgi:NAD(P)-dependent dehydrogenase (short-subunit alcohol dehydrogenase family)
VSAPVALVTGGGRGLGFAIAVALAKAGFGIAANDKASSVELRESVAKLRRFGGKADAFVADIADLSSHETLLEAAERALGPITTLVNNAGVSVLKRGDLIDVTPESYDRCEAVNARGLFFLTQAFAKRLLARDRDLSMHHSIINITSSNAVAASVDRGEYCVSKAAASMATRLFAVRLGREGINVYEIQPGIIATDMTAGVMASYVERIDNGLTLTNRVGDPTDVGSVAVSLARGDLSYCTGQIIHVDAGLLVPRF